MSRIRWDSTEAATPVVSWRQPALLSEVVVVAGCGMSMRPLFLDRTRSSFVYVCGPECGDHRIPVPDLDARVWRLMRDGHGAAVSAVTTTAERRNLATRLVSRVRITGIGIDIDWRH